MKIEARLNAVHIKEACVVCGVWDRAGEVAYFADGTGWVCDTCAEAGVEYIRDRLREQADRHRRVADEIEKEAAGDIEVLPMSPEVRAEKARIGELERQERKRLMASGEPFEPF